MKMKSLMLCALLGVVLLLAGNAYSQDVNVDYDNTFDFSTLKTFAIKIGTSWGNPLSEKRVLAEFESELTAKGWTKAEESNADAMVLLHGASSKEKSLNTFYSGGYGAYRWGGWGGGMGTATTTVTEYTIGTLVVDIFDAKSKNLVFRGVAQDEISDKPEKNQKKVQKAAEKMFKNFPPEAKKK